MNYGNHLGNDKLLSVMHEVRMQFLATLGYTELEIGGCGLIMADVMVAYRNEGRYGDIFDVALYADEISTRSFDLLYKITATRGNNIIAIADAKTGMVGYDYKAARVCQLPGNFAAHLN